MEKEFNYLRILKVDYAANFGFWLMIAPWFLYPLLSYGASSTLDIYWTLGLMLVCLIGFILMIRRMHFIKELYTQGEDSVGHLVSISHDGYRKRQTMIELEHEYQGDTYKILTDLRHSAFYKYHFRKGDNVIIRFNSKKPTEGIIRDAYFSLDGSTTPLFVPQLSESVTENKLTHLGTDFIPSEFVFSNRWVSDRIDTNLSLQQFMNMVMGYSHQNYSVDEQRNKIKIRNNLSLIINTSKFADKDIFSVEFRRYYHRIYAIYIVFMFILSIIAMPYVPFARALSTMLIISVILPIGLISMAYELVRGIKNIKPIDYGKEAERVYSEILDAVREKEKEIAK